LEKKVNTNSASISKSRDVPKPIYSISPFTLLDYPDKTACILWFAGCNMRCGYCYNPDIVLGKGKLEFFDALKFIKTRIKLLDAVVLSGGECTLHKGITELIKKIKELGLLVKVDTNGSNPKLIKELVLKKQIDFISLDFKAPAAKFQQITHSRLFTKFKETLDFLIQASFPFEVRTTIHSDLLNANDLQSMLETLKSADYKGTYFLQNFLHAPVTLGNIGSSQKSYFSPEIMETSIAVQIRNT